MIPHLIHRVWLGGPEPADLRANHRAWQEMNTGWRVRTWGNHDLSTLNLSPELRAAFDGAEHHANGADVWRMRSDIVRAAILARHGGLYVDTDFVPLRPLADLFAGLECFAVEERPGTIANGLMGATPGHPFMAALVAALADHPTGVPVWRMTGPGLLTDVAATRDDLTLLPTPLFYPYHHRDLAGGAEPTIGADAVAHHTWTSARRRVTVLVPWRDTACHHRRAAYEHVAARYRTDHPDWQVIACADDGGHPWAKGEAIRNGLAKAAGDVLVVVDADVIVPGLDAAVAEVAARRALWAMPYATLHRLDETSSRKVRGGHEPTTDMACAEKPYMGVIAGGAVVIDRAVIDDVPPDPRFHGWGGEDVAWGHALITLAGRPWRSPEPLYHLWHPPAERISRDVGNEANAALFDEYLKATGDENAMRRLLAAANKGTPWEASQPRTSATGWWRHAVTGQVRHAVGRRAAHLGADWQECANPRG